VRLTGPKARLRVFCNLGQDTEGATSMTKKPVSKTKTFPSKSLKKEGPTNRGRVLQMKAKGQPKTSRPEDPGFTQSVQQYQDGLRALQERKFDRAKSLFQKAMTGPNKELADRATVHLNACNQYLERTAAIFKSPEEHYDYAVSLINVGDYVGAREHLDKLLKQASHSDYVYYGLAVLDCLTGHFEESLRNLAEAIRLNHNNRFQARNDSDFNNLADDPRFTELLYPEGSEDSYPSTASGSSR
jgi:tetratricopeptide (TPR) repeat protein